MLQGCLQYVEELTSWKLMILVDGYKDDMLSRTTMILGGGGCNILGCVTRLGTGQTRRARVCATSWSAQEVMRWVHGCVTS